ncbi:acetoin utilization deacetylase AcuC-like enzyme [Antricoccus suffuscus]|uniref:Acetoin utilization deacetylase AcuC-like enzyme n=1 Tax=Antricoccus suffuscus TaxID=1629062 RepID=A0A2T1A1P7_9ACTN|nr:class II histone deacetylase [Antricoccus suffuscus]PRZ42529.1 acetoin utilization deacetylase AcuC-like enzyme [Antricoccus suffuscus]
MTTGWVWHERYGWYDTGRYAGVIPPGGWGEPDIHMENGETKRRLASLVSACGLSDQLHSITPHVASDEELLVVHTGKYLSYLKEQDAQFRGGVADIGIGRTTFSSGDLEIARLAVGGVMDAAGAVARGDVKNAYALTRPPGHHALPDTGLGFCVFANIPLAIHDIRKKYGVERVAVVDWDVHHGNGTQDIFWNDPNVLTISMHQDRLFPKFGLVGERGGAEAEGSCLNIPLPPGSGGGAYRSAFERVVIPALAKFRPEMIVVASGFDSGNFDPNGRMMLNSGDYRWMTEQVLESARQLCDDRVLVVHEGGYSAFYVPFCGLAVIEALSGIKSPADDPCLERLVTNPMLELQPHQTAYIDNAVTTLKCIR